MLTMIDRNKYDESRCVYLIAKIPAVSLTNLCRIRLLGLVSEYVRLLRVVLPFSKSTEKVCLFFLYAQYTSKYKLLLCVFMLVIGLSNSGKAANLGVHGATFKILEEDLLESIENKLSAFEEKGDLLRLQEKMKTNLKNNLANPKAVQGIKRTEKQKSWLYNPSISLDSDLADHNGKVFYKRGTKVNPLDIINLTKGMLFIDGTDKQQVAWALNIKKKNKVILVAGSAIELMKSNKIRFYYDIKGKLTSKFGIKHVPASLFQEGNQLRITEVRL